MDDTEIDDNKAKGHRLQADIFSFEGDRGRLERKRDEILIEVKRLKTGIKRLEVEMQSKEAEAQTVEREIARVNDEITHLKKEMNAL